MKNIMILVVVALLFLAGCGAEVAEEEPIEEKTSDRRVVEDIPEEEQPEDKEENTYYCTSRDRAIEACITLYKPVCADKGYTYSNACIACMDPDVESVVDGEC